VVEECLKSLVRGASCTGPLNRRKFDFGLMEKRRVGSAET